MLYRIGSIRGGRGVDHFDTDCGNREDVDDDDVDDDDVEEEETAILLETAPVEGGRETELGGKTGFLGWPRAVGGRNGAPPAANA